MSLYVTWPYFERTLLSHKSFSPSSFFLLMLFFLFIFIFIFIIIIIDIIIIVFCSESPKCAISAHRPRCHRVPVYLYFLYMYIV